MMPILKTVINLRIVGRVADPAILGYRRVSDLALQILKTNRFYLSGYVPQAASCSPRLRVYPVYENCRNPQVHNLTLHLTPNLFS